jgi:hypothetical protein
MEDRSMRTAMWVILLLTLATACASGPSKAELDAEVRRLCAIDGGVKVYEVVKLPAERFDKYGRVHIPSKQQAKSDDDYYFDYKVTYLRNGDPDVDVSDASIARVDYRVFRANDKKLLGESVRYIRRGGDSPGPWHPSSFTCPDTKNAIGVEKMIFVDGESR